MKGAIFTVIIIFIQGLASAQNIALTNEKILTKQQATNDYNILYSALINYHPKPFTYITESDLNFFFETQKSNLPDTINELDFHYVCRQLILQIRCGHTQARPSKTWYTTFNDQYAQLPFDIKKINGRFYIKNTIDEIFDFVVNDEILSINDVSINDIFERMSLMQERDGFTESFNDATIEKRFRTYFLFLMGFQKEYLIGYKTNSGEIKKVTVQPTNKKLKEIKAHELPADFKKIKENSWSTFCFDTTTNLAYLKISNFSDRKEFKAYYESVFNFLNEKHNSKLIIDIRDNPGGFYGNGNHFLTYLTPNKFDLIFRKSKTQKLKNNYIGLNKSSKRTKFAFSIKPSKYKEKGQSTTTFSYKPSKELFEGKLFVITNGNTFSQAALIAAHLNEYGAVFFGQETGGTEMGCNGILSYDLVLPNSEIFVTVPVYNVKSNSSKGKFGYGVKPNYLILPKLDNSKDHLLEEVITIIKGGG